MTSSPWLRDYVLQGLGSEIRKQGGLSLSLSQQGQEQEKAVGQKQNLGGQQQQQQQYKSSTTRLVKIIARSSNFDNKRTSNRACCWLLVSDGSCSVKIHFTVQALEQIYDCDNNNNNENSSKISANNNNNDCFFGRGCCILLKKYSVEYDLFHVGTNNNNNSNDGTVDLVNVIANLNNIDMERYPVRLKVSSLEAKPSFNNHITISANNTNNNNNNNNNNNSIAAIRPVLEDIDVLYAIQYLKRQQQIQRNNNNNNNVGNGSGSGSRRSIARDWDIAFGRLSKGNFVANDGDTDDHDTTYDTSSSSRNLQQIINLADKACTTDEAIRVWDMAKNEYGINGNGNDDDTGDGGDDTGDGDIFNNKVNGAMAMTTNNKKTTTTTTTTNLPDQQDINKDGGCKDDDDDDDDDNDEEEEDHSRMYIQNVLATQEDEDDNNDEDENEDEEPLLLQTQPQSNTIARRNTTTPSTATSRNEKSTLDTTQSPVTKIATVMQTQPPRDGVVDDAAPPIPPNKRPQISGTTDSPSMLESAKQYQQKRQRLHQEKQQPMQQQQDEEESSKNNIGTSIWESIKEQCFDESRPFLHFVPSWRIASSGDNNNDIPITPNKKIKSTTSINYNNTDIGSVGSIGTNFALSSPNPSSGAYYKKYGLARWLKKNTAGDNNKDNDDDFANDTINTPNTNRAN